MERPDIGILGAGAFGTALAIAMSVQDRRVRLWARDAEHAGEMVRAGENARRLPGMPFPTGLSATAALDEVCAAPVVLLAVPTQQLRAVLSANSALLRDRILVACCKGIEMGTGLLPTQVIEDVLPGAKSAVLTGPSFAVDIARGKPTALTLACDEALGDSVQHALATRNLRLYLSHDVIGAQMGGALKNVVAIASGVAMGAGLGESARAALMTRGFAEIMRVAQSRGAQADTLWGLSGFGDLVLTCTSDKSRNYSHGQMVGAGETPPPGATVEGVSTARAMAQVADADQMPVIAMVSAVLDGKVDLAQAVEQLLSRPLRHELG